MTNQDIKKPKPAKCKLCGRRYVSKSALIDHIGREHKANIPEGWSPARYECYLRTGKTTGYCVYCKTEVGFNEKTGKYNRMCGSATCKKKAHDLAQKNYIGLHGKPYTIDDPEVQRKMVYGKKNSGAYIFVDDVTGRKYKVLYDSSFGKDFFQMLDLFLGWDGSDVSGPSPHTYYYIYEGKQHFYVPDAYIHSLNLEVELKDGGDDPNTHPKIQAVDKVKEAKKDEVMLSLKDQVNYIKICNKDYKEFFALLSYLKDKDVCELPKWEARLESPNYKSAVSEGAVVEGRDLVTTQKDSIVAQVRLSDPNKLDYNKLILSYRNRLFHEKLSQVEWDDLYRELRSIESQLQRSINLRDEEASRMAYESKKCLVEVQKMLHYMDDTGYRHCVESTVITGNSITFSKNLDNAIDVATTMSDMDRSFLEIDESVIHELVIRNRLIYHEELLVNGDPASAVLLIKPVNLNKCGQIVIYTTPQYQGKGYATKLIVRLFNNIRDSETTNKLYGKYDPMIYQIDWVLYGVDPNNIKSIKFAQSVGFVDICERRDDAIIYKKSKTDIISASPTVVQEECIIPNDFVEVNESVIISNNDIYNNFDNWQPKQGSNVLLITGLSGSGKTTIGYELAYVHRAELFQLDWISHQQYIQNSPETPNYGLWQYVKTRCAKELSKVEAARKEEKTSNNLWHKIILTVFNTILEFANKNTTKLFIVEGVQIPGHLHDYPGIETFPIIIKGTSVMKSMFRRFRRDTIQDFLKTGGDNILKYYADSEKYMNMFRKQITESVFTDPMGENIRRFPIFVFLSYTYSRMATLIKNVSGDPYAHSSISFDTSLKNMVSFNSQGMVVENIYKDIYNTNKDIIRYSLYMYAATEDEYRSVRQFVDELLGKQKYLRYNLLGLTNFIFGRGSQREDAFFCSEFVSAAIAAGNDNIFDRPPYMIKPYYFAKNKHFTFIKTGLLKNYSQLQIDKIVASKLEKGVYKDV